MARKIAECPPEILDKICSNLHARQDLSSARATCRSLKAAADRYAFRHIKFCMHREDFYFLRQIANDHRALYVQSLTYNSHIMEEFDRSELAFWENDDQDAIADTENAVNQIREGQFMVMEMDEDFDFLKDVIPKFPNLRELVVATVHDEFFDPDEADNDAWASYGFAYRYLSRQMYGASYHEGTIRHLHAMLEGLRAAGGSLQRLTSLQVGFLSITSDDGYFRDPDYTTRPWPFDPKFLIKDMLGVQLSYLTHFGLLLHNGSQFHRPEDRPLIEAAKDHRLTVARDLTTSMPNLQSLTVGARNDAEWIYKLIPYHHVWPELHTIHLINVRFSYEGLLDVLSVHKKTLRTLIFDTCRLFGADDAGWGHFVDDLKASFRPFTLHCICFYNENRYNQNPICQEPTLQSYLRDTAASGVDSRPRIMVSHTDSDCWPRPEISLKRNSYFPQS
ncbi:hypothetical protein QBC40DRAFT_94493 [Triangularia verruculosa]|uniref:F-box domain-containing protein n=1 Tax=Triangularia verruculosa TaxID=2587418 RepID=A0AAN7ATS1_9PEZI|nr:hypothetical protein QBC40DRAFT_94493 [Triangularia verruculosa]